MNRKLEMSIDYFVVVSKHGSLVELENDTRSCQEEEHPADRNNESDVNTVFTDTPST